MGVIDFVITLCAVSGGIYVFFDRVGRVMKTEVRDSFKKSLKNLHLGVGLQEWAAHFSFIFDDVFGKKHFTLKCFRRSCAVSLCVVIIIGVLCYIIKPIVINKHLSCQGWRFTLSFLLAASVCNLIPDYISLIETRYIIGKLASARSLRHIIFLLIIDVAATYGIFAIIGFFLGIVGGKSTVIEMLGELIRWPFFKSLKQGADNDAIMGIFLWSTFFTSVWVWLYLAAIALIRFAKIYERVWSFLDIEQKPFQSLALVAATLSTIVLLILQMLILLFF